MVGFVGWYALGVGRGCDLRGLLVGEMGDGMGWSWIEEAL